MANKRVDVSGLKFGLLTAISPHERMPDGRWAWSFSCDCGAIIYRRVSTVIKSKKEGKISHCGCANALKTHGLTKSNKHLNWVWSAMKQRCGNPNCKDYHNYGGRGISMCQDWMDFNKFHSWAVSSGYRRGVTIERIDVNGDYVPENCKWIPNDKQALNRSNNKRYQFRGSMMTARQISECTGLKYNTVRGRLNRNGGNAELAVKGLIDV